VTKEKSFTTVTPGWRNGRVLVVEIFWHVDVEGSGHGVGRVQREVDVQFHLRFPGIGVASNGRNSGKVLKAFTKLLMKNLRSFLT